MKSNKVDVLLVSYTKNPEGKPLLVVGRKNDGELADVVNAFIGDKAFEIYNSLITGGMKDDK